jgi:insulysin
MSTNSISLGASAARFSKSKEFKVVKPQLDERQYQFTVLPNGLEVILVSDPKTPKAAAAMDVHVGSFNDPEELPG